MSKCSLVIGMGIGQLYKDVLSKLDHKVITVDRDPDKLADFTELEDAITGHVFFDTVHICTPNFTHASIARQIAPYAKIVFVEKPGVSTSVAWSNVLLSNPLTRFMMVKNNMWRSNIADLQALASTAKTVKIKWIRKNCIPSPGSWFTTKKLAFGGVSRDLMPHLLSLYIAMNPQWRADTVSGTTTLAAWKLEDIDSTDYGTVDPKGTYDVDDVCVINFADKWTCAANWRSMDVEDSSIEFIMPDNSAERFELGWCPEAAYYNMIKDAVDNLENMEFWKEQLAQDLWIHQQIENL